MLLYYLPPLMFQLASFGRYAADLCHAATLMGTIVSYRLEVFRNADRGTFRTINTVRNVRRRIGHRSDEPLYYDSLSHFQKRTDIVRSRSGAGSAK
jgi:hypothetical protein